MKSVNRQKPSGLWRKTKYANLVRNSSSGIYFARFRTNGKLIWRGLDTDILTTAAQRLPDTIKKIKDEQELLASGSDPSITFEAAAKIYMERVAASPDFKPRTKAYHEQRLDALFKSWPGVKSKTIKEITKADCVDWRNRFAAKYSATSFNHTLGILRAIFEIGIDSGARRDKPAKAKEMKRLSEVSKRLRLPEPEQLDKFVAEIANAGSGFSKPCAELVQFLAYGGFRITEAKHITWGDCDLVRGKIAVHGEPETGLKGRQAGECREVPIIPDMRRLLEGMRSNRADEPPAMPVTRVHECQKAMNRAAAKVGMTRITHHDLRHLFATRAIESSVDIPTVSRWLGHKDGGALAMRVYGHLRDQHSNTMAQKVTFSTTAENIIPVPKATEPLSAPTHTSAPDERRAVANAKAKYSYPWWVSENGMEVFWGQVNEPVQIISTDKFLAAAKEAMGREVLRQELADSQALIDEFEARVSKAVLNGLATKIPKQPAVSEKVSPA